ncbi:ORF MSV138 hypothetical protein [Melanoplus sanguinipes entomopoxvirus]|uniref:Uncharacterized protein n=1 Tax=Melanoplus sanguinipes entomopoxvirus TaxID=83191 RepID=Q9YVV4_MSEPV|nr:ORF MSV138 hypothetical protein [Melanoplus sanguinipes entomopoxvirus]AAC97670.1 ORF MSV138 hypothetical protein [Melanoplus sanguinipes entomopoxvirus 'O']
MLINNMKTEIKIDKDLINKLINKIYKDNVPRNSILTYCINLIKDGEIKNEYYKINNVYKRDDLLLYDKTICDNNEIINVNTIGNYSPLLEYFKFKNIKYELTDSPNKDLYNRSEEILSFLLSNGQFNEDCSFISNNDIIFYNYINDIKNNSNNICEKLFLFTQNKNIDPDFLPKECLKNVKNKITINIQL